VGANSRSLARLVSAKKENYLKIKIKKDFTLHFGKKICKHKPTISTLKSFVLQKASDVLQLNNMASLQR